MSSFLVAQPPPRLRGLVRRFWYVEDACAHGRELKLPGLEWQLLINLGATGLSVCDDRSHVKSTSGAAVAHVGRRAVELDRAEQRQLAGVVFAPGAFPLLFGVPAEALSDPLVDLEDLGLGTGIRERCLPVSGGSGVLAALAAELAPRAAGCPDAALDAALRMLATGRSVAETADRLGRSESGLLRMFRRDVGMAPKRAQRLLRFSRAARALHRRQMPAAAAALAGYADQAHLTHDFVELTGLTPGQYRRAGAASAMHVPG